MIFQIIEEYKIFPYINIVCSDLEAKLSVKTIGLLRYLRLKEYLFLIIIVKNIQFENFKLLPYEMRKGLQNRRSRVNKCQ